MKDVLFLATYFNNPHFIEFQMKSLKTFVENDFDFVVLDDSKDDTVSILSSKLARDEIKSEAEKYGAQYMQVPQSIHAYYSQGGYVPNENPNTSHPTERHQALIRWILTNYKKLGFDNYKVLALIDADVFFRRKTDMVKYMEYDIMGSFRTQTINLPLGNFPDKMFPEKVKKLNGTTIDFLTLCILFVNLQKVNNLETMDVGSWPGTDTGSKTNFFIKENTQYTYSFIIDYQDPEYRSDLFSKRLLRGLGEVTEKAEMLHYRAGSNWGYEQPDYYRAKLNGILNKYIPEIAVPNTNSSKGEFISYDGEHTVKAL